MTRLMSKSFYEWCVENSHEDWLELWDYELNKINPKDITYKTHKKYWFKCPRKIHKSELKYIVNLVTGNTLLKCNQCNSIGQYLIDEYGENALELYWDYKNNVVNPFEIPKSCNKKVWIFCQDTDYHDSYEIACSKFYIGRRCSYCAMRKIHPKDSFAQYHIDNTDSDFLEKYWSKKNTIDPFTIAPRSTKKVWIKCQEKDYHDSYVVSCDSFSGLNSRCSYCGNLKIHSKDSFAQYHIDNTDPNFLEKYWSDKNTVNPFEIAPRSTKKVWIKCQNNEEHKDYEVTCSHFLEGNRCPICKESKGERRIREVLNKHNVDFIAQKTFPNLLGVRNGNLSYDFYLPSLNLLIEYQGEQHDGNIKYSSETQEEYEKRFKRQQEHDKRKKEYAESHNIRLLEIWYWDFDNIETILNENIK